MDYYHENPPIACFIIKLGVPSRPTGTPRRREVKSEHNSRESLATASGLSYAGNYILHYHHEPSMNSLLTLHEFSPTPADSILFSLQKALGLARPIWPLRACFIIKLGAPGRLTGTPRRKEWKSEHNSRGSLAIAPVLCRQIYSTLPS